MGAQLHYTAASAGGRGCATAMLLPPNEHTGGTRRSGSQFGGRRSERDMISACQRPDSKGGVDDLARLYI